MTRLLRLICACALAAAISALGASAALATTFYVNGTTGKDTNACTEPEAPCKTITAAVTKSEAVEDTATIEVAAGVYREFFALTHSADSGITIRGAGSGGGGTEIEGLEKTSSPTVRISLTGAVTLSNLSIVNDQPEDTGNGITTSGEVTLENVLVDMKNAGAANGIEAGGFGSVSMSNGGVSMESPTEGHAILAHVIPLTINNATVTVASGSKAGGIASESSAVSITNTSVSLPSSSAQVAIVAAFAAATLTNVSVTQGAAGVNAFGIEFFFPSSASLSGSKVTMTNAANKAAGVAQVLGTGIYEHLEVGGAWTGLAVGSEGGNVTLRDSRLIESAASVSPAFAYFGTDEGPGSLIQRSVLQASPAAVPGALQALNGNLTLDSSEILGGHLGVSFEQGAGKTRTLTLAASTIDAGNLGVADGAGVSGVGVFAATGNNTAKADIKGSILLEPQIATVALGGKSATITCTNSDIPNQTQAPKGTEGTIGCASGTSGNASSAAASLFATPITNYQLNPFSSAIDSVPAGAINLPFGLTLSATDLAGTPRVVDGNGDCAALQDKGALELQGHSVACPTIVPPPGPKPPPSPKLLPGVISALTITPSSFAASPSGATISSAVASAKKKYGATISYRDSLVATTTFTIFHEVSGRKQGGSCKRPAKSNRHGKRCTILTTSGGFSHADRAGTNSLHFSGRLKGKKLVKGAYKLRAVPHNAAGNGIALSRSFTVK